MDLDLQTRPESPPRLVVVRHQRGPKEAYIVADAMNFKCAGENLLDFLTFLFACYYSCDLAYPNQYQVLGFLQLYVFQDTANNVVRGTNFQKFEKTYLKAQ